MRAAVAETFHLFPVQQHVQGEDAEHGVLEVRIVVHDDRHHADVRQQSLGATDHVGFGQPQLVFGVQTAIVHLVVVALGQELQLTVAPAKARGLLTDYFQIKWFRHSLLVDLDHPMHNGYVASANLEHDDVADAHRLLGVIGEEQQVAALEGRLHAAGQHHDDRRLAVGGHHQALPDHQRRGDDHAEAQHLEEELPGRGSGRFRSGWGMVYALFGVIGLYTQLLVCVAWFMYTGWAYTFRYHRFDLHTRNVPVFCPCAGHR